MALKQRFQNLALGDTARLQSFVLNNAGCAFFKTVAKVEIYEKLPSVATISNPDGLVLFQTIVSHLGRPTTEIFPYPNQARAEYWETDLCLDADEYQIGKYVDRWYYILDENYDFYYPVARDPYPDDTVTDGTASFMGILGISYINVVTDDLTVFMDDAGTAIDFTADNFPTPTAVNFCGDFIADGSFLATVVQKYPGNTQSCPWSGWITAANYTSGTMTIRTDSNTIHTARMEGRTVRVNGITDGTGSFADLTYTSTIAQIENIEDKDIRGIIDPDPDYLLKPSGASHWYIPNGFFSDPISVAGYVITWPYNNSSVVPPVTPLRGGFKYLYFKAVSSNGVDWTCDVTFNPDVDTITDFSFQSMTLEVADDVIRFNIKWTTAGSMVSYPVSVLAWLIDEWKVEGVDYVAGRPNPWDDLIERTASSKQLTVDHSFEVYSEQWMASSHPITGSWQFSVEPSSYYVYSTDWMRVSVAPLIQLHPETQRYHYTLLAKGILRYEVYRIEASDISRFRRIAQGTAYWHEENTALVKIDANQTPFNRGQECFIVFYVDMPDGRTIRSQKVNFQIIDDLRISRPDDTVI